MRLMNIRLMEDSRKRYFSGFMPESHERQDEKLLFYYIKKSRILSYFYGGLWYNQVDNNTF